MAEDQHNADNINVSDQTGDFAQQDYKMSDFERVFNGAKAKNWNDLGRYVADKGDQEWHITPGEASAMKRDIDKAAKDGKSFPKDANEGFNTIKSGGRT